MSEDIRSPAAEHVLSLLARMVGAIWPNACYTAVSVALSPSALVTGPVTTQPGVVGAVTIHSWFTARQLSDLR